LRQSIYTSVITGSTGTFNGSSGPLWRSILFPSLRRGE